MKSLLLSLFLLCAALSGMAQGASINDTGNPPDPSAGLDVDFSNKGMLIPRLTTTERNTIVSPGQALMIYNTTTKCFEFFENGLWQSMFCSCNPPSAPGAGSHSSAETSITWNWTAGSGAAGYKYSTSNDYSSATDMGTATSYAQSGLSCGTNYTLYVWSYNTCGASASPVTLTASTTACWNCGSSVTVSHTAGSVAPESKTVTYATVSSNLTGSTKCWLAQNLGADAIPSAVNDDSEASRGWYWQFNRAQGYKHNGGTSFIPSGTWNDTNDNTYTGWDPAKDPCILLLGPAWRLPTGTEWTNADANGGWTNGAGAFASVLKLHMPGLVNPPDGSLFLPGDVGNYQSSTQFSTTIGYNLRLNGSQSYADSSLEKKRGMSVRCIRD